MKAQHSHDSRITTLFFPPESLASIVSGPAAAHVSQNTDEIVIALYASSHAQRSRTACRGEIFNRTSRRGGISHPVLWHPALGDLPIVVLSDAMLYSHCDGADSPATRMSLARPSVRPRLWEDSMHRAGDLGQFGRNLIRMLARHHTVGCAALCTRLQHLLLCDVIDWDCDGQERAQCQDDAGVP
jgi:hypothetical protein